jgi:hypothetical protein
MTLNKAFWFRMLNEIDGHVTTVHITVSTEYLVDRYSGFWQY